MDFDVAIIGGGPAGSSSAIYLSQLGYKVVVLEKEIFPRDHVGESLIPFCYYRMKEMGVLEKIAKFATKKPGVNFVDRDGSRESTWCFDHILHDGAEMSYHTLRAPFDKALLDHAETLGATVRYRQTVRNADLTDPGKVTLEILDENQKRSEVTSRFLIDASGQGSFLGKKFQAKVAYSDLDRVALFSHWINTEYDTALRGGIIKIAYLGGGKKGWIWVIPVGRNHLSIGVTLNNAYVRERKKELGEDWAKKLYLSELAEATVLDSILAPAVMEHSVQVLGDFSYYIDKKYSTNYAMVGDSSAFLDPIFSSGIYVAMESAKRVARALDVKLREGSMAVFEEEFKTINGAYGLIEKFVRLFYDPALLNFAHVRADKTGFERFLAAYEIFHYLLAGDFFREYERYSQFLDELTTERSFHNFIAYVKNIAKDAGGVHPGCTYKFEAIYGHLPMGGTVFPGLIGRG